MGRLTTRIAAWAVCADNLPPAAELPNVSVLEALLPPKFTPLHGHGVKRAKSPPRIVRHTDIAKDKRGKLRIVNHLAKLDPVIVAVKGKTKQLGDPKPTKTSASAASTKGKAEDDGKTTSPSNDNKVQDRNTFTAEEDAQLHALVEANTPWKQVAREMKRAQSVLKKRWQDSQSKATTQVVITTAPDASKPGNATFNQANKEFSTEEDAKLREFKKTNTSWKKIAEEMGRSLQELKARWKIIEGANANQAEVQDGDKKKKAEVGDDTQSSDHKDQRCDDAKKMNDKRAPSHKSASVCSHHSNLSGIPVFSAAEWEALQQDGLLTFQEICFLSRLIVADSTVNWLQLASFLLDEYGHRVHPDDLKDRFEAIASTGVHR